MGEALAGADVQRRAGQPGRGRPRPLGRDAARLFWAAVVVGVGARLIVAFSTYGVPFDTHSAYAVKGALETDPLHLYSLVNDSQFRAWPYGDGFLPFMVIADWLGQTTGTPFHGWVQVPQILSDAGIAWLVQQYLGLRGASDRVRLAAAGLVILGPSFAVVSGFHGQYDPIAILPAVAALVVWERSPPGTRRGLLAGALIGLAVVTKTSPLLVLFALLPSAREWRERAALCAAVAIVPLTAMAPFLVADGGATLDSLREHRALPGIGGLSLIAQPDLARHWLEGARVPVSSLSQTLVDNQALITGVLMLPFLVLVFVRRVPPALAATLLWLAFFVFAPGFSQQYVVWALPFALMAGYVRQVAVLQAALLVPTILIYFHADVGSYTPVYVTLMIAIWLALIAVLARLTLRVARTRA
jgi:hypothetical protein